MKGKRLQFYFAVLGMAMLFAAEVSPVMAAKKWSVSSAIQYSSGNYIFDQNTSTFYLYGGLRYRGSRWQVSASIPLIRQNSDLITGSGGAFFPSSHHRGDDPRDTHHRGGMGSVAGSEIINGVGDLYLSGSLELLRGRGDRLAMILHPRIKVPTASSEKGFGSGKMDFGMSLTLRKQFGSYIAIGDAGFWVLGDPAEVTYKDPLVVGIGAGKFFSGGHTGILLYYETYTTILEGLAPLRQLSLGLNHRLREEVMLNIVGAAGFSDATPDVSFSGGVEWFL